MSNNEHVRIFDTTSARRRAVAGRHHDSLEEKLRIARMLEQLGST